MLELRANCEHRNLDLTPPASNWKGDDPSSPLPLEIWFEFGSTYSYLSVMRIEEQAARWHVPLVWRPFLLGPIFQAHGWQGSPFLEQPAKLAFMWRDMARQATKHGLPWKQPSAFPRASLLPMRVAMACAQEPWIGAFCRAVMLQNFRDDIEINAVSSVHRVLMDLGLPIDEVMERAQAEVNKLALRRQTERAAQMGIFGGPSFMVDQELFWGDDRLDDALRFASARGVEAIHGDAHRPGDAIAAADAPVKRKPSNYPEPFAQRMVGRIKRPLGDLFGLRSFGVNLTRLNPGAVSSLHHRHSAQDELVYVLSGRPTLYVDDRRQQLRAGMVVGFAAAGPAHHIANETADDCLLLEVGDRNRQDQVSYPHDDLQAVMTASGQWSMRHKDGSAY